MDDILLTAIFAVVPGFIVLAPFFHVIHFMMRPDGEKAKIVRRSRPNLENTIIFESVFLTVIASRDRCYSSLPT